MHKQIRHLKYQVTTGYNIGKQVDNSVYSLSL